MKYFIDAKKRNECGGTLFFEFQRGDKNQMWNADSLYLSAITFDEMKLYNIFNETLTNFSYWGITEISEEQWRSLYKNGVAKEGIIAELFEEMQPWAEECFNRFDKIVLIGI